VPNLVITSVGDNGKVALHNGSAGTVQLVADVAGYFLSGAPTLTGTFRSLDPSRLLDTRSGLGADRVAVAAGATAYLEVLGHGGVPASGVSAVAVNVTVTGPAKPGFVRVYADGTAPPGGSNLNFTAGQTAANLVIAPVGANGKVALRNLSGGTVHFIADLSGWFAESPGQVTGVTGISGTVTDAGGALSGVERFLVTLTSASIGGSGQAIAFADGMYSTSGLPPAADYVVCFSAFGDVGYAEECFDNQPITGTPTPVAVTSGAMTTGIDAALTTWGSISGTVTEAGGQQHGPANVAVLISSVSTGASEISTTAADGSHSSNGLPSASDYAVCFFSASNTAGGSTDMTGYANQCYLNQPISGGTPTPVTVTAGVDIAGINPALSAAG